MKKYRKLLLKLKQILCQKTEKLYIMNTIAYACWNVTIFKIVFTRNIWNFNYFVLFFLWSTASDNEKVGFSTVKYFGNIIDATAMVTSDYGSTLDTFAKSNVFTKKTVLMLAYQLVRISYWAHYLKHNKPFLLLGSSFRTYSWKGRISLKFETRFHSYWFNWRYQTKYNHNQYNQIKIF